jgi:hypothetical protein
MLAIGLAVSYPAPYASSETAPSFTFSIKELFFFSDSLELGQLPNESDVHDMP